MTEREFLEKKYANMLTRYDSGASVILYTGEEDGRPKAMLFRPKSKKAWRKFTFESELQRMNTVDNFVKGVDKEIADKQNRRREKKTIKSAFKDSVEVGQLFHYTWGFPRIRVDFYKLVEKNKDTVRLVQIGSKFVSDDGGGKFVVPDPDNVVGPGMLKKYGPGCFAMPEGMLQQTTTATKHYVSK